MACPSSSPSMPASPRQGEARLGGCWKERLPVLTDRPLSPRTVLAYFTHHALQPHYSQAACEVGGQLRVAILAFPVLGS